MTTTTTDAKFSLGLLTFTAAVMSRVNASEKFMHEVMACVKRHVTCDFSEMDDEDVATNLEAVATGENRVFSAYETSEGKIWIITEWDRSSTCVLFPEDY